MSDTLSIDQPSLDGSTAPALRSVYTSNLPNIPAQLNISLAVSTYQAGKVIPVRNDGGTINTHFRSFAKPMGIAADNSRLTIGGSNTVWYYRNMPAVAPKIEPQGKHDACYLPRRIHVTGDIDIHELAWSSDDTLWLVNTKFCTLCTGRRPQLHPSLAAPLCDGTGPEDRCHLNGLAMVNGQPKYVTAPARLTPPAAGEPTKDGGILMDVDSNEILLRGLSMPHSRLYNDQLWLLESGEGSIAKVDLEQRSWQNITKLPGFTRGIDFIGPLAFIGLSQVRESATFSGIPPVDRLEERTCGVWVVNIQTGETVAFLRFEEGVQEIFAVNILPARFPEMLEWGDKMLATSYVVPDAALADVPQTLKQ